jgi:hypothetical protein
MPVGAVAAVHVGGDSCMVAVSAFSAPLQLLVERTSLRSTPWGQANHLFFQHLLNIF